MELEIITERESSPFRYVFPREYTNGRRYGSNLGHMQLVMDELLTSLSLSRNIITLEVGAGHGQEPSKALFALGATPKTLDADWNKYCEESIPTIEDLERMGEALLYPTKVGNNGVVHYLGDVAFIGDQRSQLRDEKFRLLFYWGSIDGTFFCSSVTKSITAIKFDKKVTLGERLLAPIQNLEDSGYMVNVPGFLNMAGDPPIHPKNVMYFNGRMVDVLLLWANYEKRKPSRVIVFGLSPDFSFKYLREHANQDGFVGEITEAEIQEAVDNDTIGTFMKNHWSMFSDYEAKDSSAYKKALEIFSPEQQKAINKLGLVDCIAVQYESS